MRTGEVWDKLDLCTLVLTNFVCMGSFCYLDVKHNAEADAIITGVLITQLSAVNTTLLWLRAVQMLSGFDSTAKYVSMFFAIMHDMRSFLLMIMIFIVGNGFVMTLLFPTRLAGSQAVDNWMPDDSHGVRLAADTLPRAMFSSFNMMMGGFDAELLNSAYSPAIAWITYFYYILMVNIVMVRSHLCTIRTLSIDCSPSDRMRFEILQATVADFTGGVLGADDGLCAAFEIVQLNLLIALMGGKLIKCAHTCTYNIMIYAHHI